MKLELAAHPVLKAAIADCEACGDYVSRDLFRGILESEEDHIDWLETQLDLIDKVGIANYQQSQMHGDAVTPRPSRADGAVEDAEAVAIAPAMATRCPRVVSSETLLAGASQLAILHNDALYYLRQTRLGKLILTK